MVEKPVEAVQEEEKKEESKEEQAKEDKPEKFEIKKSEPIIAMQLFDEKWMELYAYNLSHDLIFVIIDYLLNQMKLILKDKIGNDDEVFVWKLIDYSDSQVYRWT